ncbi:MAG: HD domain-containing phosphohydrolase [Gemmatimonadales bacterium]
MSASAPLPTPLHPPRPAGQLLADGIERERAGDIPGAIAFYRFTIEAAASSGDAASHAVALRRLAVLAHFANQPDEAQSLARESHTVALEAHDPVRAAEALNVLAGFALERGDLEIAEGLYGEAAVLGAKDRLLAGRVAQNRGIIANVKGDWVAATDHYRRSLDEFVAAGDDPNCAIAYHNLGIVTADHGDFDRADDYYRQARNIAVRIGDVRLGASVQLNAAEVQIARGEGERALGEANAALQVFTGLGSELDKADAYRVVGTAYRLMGQRQLALARLVDAVKLSERTGSSLAEAAAVRELSLLYHDLGRNQDALRGLTRAHRLFTRLDARRELVDIAQKVRTLEDTYLAVVRDWGRSIESADSYTFGHCERVARFGVLVAEALGTDEMASRTVQLGAYLHDLGKVKVPHEILSKPGRLTDDEFAVIKRHPEWGEELLVEVEFPWDLKPVIRWHHEKLDGTGYPDRLAGDRIPLSAQIICVVDVWDALTTTRSYRAAMELDRALGIMEESRHWWRPEIYAAFQAAVPGATPVDPARRQDAVAASSE